MFGAYKITARTPIGPEKGTLRLSADGRQLTGVIDIMGDREDFTGEADGERFSFSTTLHKVVINIPITVSGMINNDGLIATAVCRFGEVPIKGVKEAL